VSAIQRVWPIKQKSTATYHVILSEQSRADLLDIMAGDQLRRGVDRSDPICTISRGWARYLALHCQASARGQSSSAGRRVKLNIERLQRIVLTCRERTQGTYSTIAQ
jgi:hypothetical protein